MSPVYLLILYSTSDEWLTDTYYSSSPDICTHFAITPNESMLVNKVNDTEDDDDVVLCLRHPESRNENEEEVSTCFLMKSVV